MRSGGKAAAAAGQPSSVCILAALALLAGTGILAGAGKKKPEAYALIAGTVFDDRGFALRGAPVSLAPGQPQKPPRKFKPSRILTDARGEFAFRVPAEPFTYQLKVQAPGFVSEEKPVVITADERVDVYFQLVRASPEESSTKDSRGHRARFLHEAGPRMAPRLADCP